MVFTGIVEELGSLTASEPAGDGIVRLVFGAETVTDGTAIGDSVAVNGCCLTVVDTGPGLVVGRRRTRDARPHQPGLAPAR